MQVPAKDELISAIFRMQSDALIAKYFGKDWYKRGDPRPLLPVTYQDVYDWYEKYGIPQSVLIEGTWGGHEHFVITERGGEWLVGYAERGGASLASRHRTLKDAREAVLKELWSLHEGAGNPSYWKDGVAAGTPYA
ncbi:MAG: hypothetical protein ACOY4U_11240 [Pseudomonadota bacterium]